MSEAAVLDDQRKIREIDKSSMLSFCVEASRHYSEAVRLAKSFSLSFDKPQTVIVAGMGGSAIGGELSKDWARDRIDIPVEICREYSLPKYADRNTLVLVVSYSGETEETLSVFLDAIRRKCMIACISSGGTLNEFAEKLSIPRLLVPSGMAPRASLPYLLMPTIITFQRIGLISGIDFEISETAKILQRISEENSLDRPLTNNSAKKLAANLNGTIPAVYGFGFYRSVAQRLKTQFNENSKNPAKWEFLSELDHNEIVGWEVSEDFSDLFSAVFIRDAEEPVEVHLRIEATKELMSHSVRNLFELQSQGRGRLAKMMSIICIGDFTSVYLAILRGVDPTPVKTIALLKEKLEKSGVKQKVLRELHRLALA